MGVTSGASVPEILVREVLEHLAARGFADVTPVVAAEESIMFSLPTEIRRDLKAAGMSDKMRHDAELRERRLGAALRSDAGEERMPWTRR